MRRWYQTIEIDGVDAIFEDKNRKYSRFWNEGKWDTFIEPLLPDRRNTFLEIGCNAGLFLKMAVDAGFKNVTGVEGNYQIVKQALQFRESNGYNYKIVHQHVGTTFVLDDLPLPDVVLFSNVHYYFPVGVFAKLVDVLRTRALYCIVVSAKAKRRQGNALYDIKSIEGYFRDWEKFPAILGVDIKDDPAPRDQMYSILFRGGLDICEVDVMYDAWMEASKKLGHKSHELAPALHDFTIRVLSGEEFDLADTDFYRFWRKRLPNKPPEWTLNHLEYKKSLVEDIRENGIKEPIYIDKSGKLLDGLHRLCTAKLLKYGHILMRIL